MLICRDYRNQILDIALFVHFERPRGDAIPEAARVSPEGVGLKALFVRTACRVLCADWDTVSLMAKCCAGLRASL